MSEIAIDLMRRLICDRSERLGRNGIQEFKEHPFFLDVDWDNLRKSEHYLTHCFERFAKGVPLYFDKSFIENQNQLILYFHFIMKVLFPC